MKKFIRLLSPLAVLFFLSWPGSTAVNQTGIAILRLAPLLKGLKPEEKGTISILIANVEDMYGLEFHMSFDPNILQVEDAAPTREGVQIVSTDIWEDGFVAVNHVDNILGRIDFAATRLNPSPPLSGDVAVATITFRALHTGISEVSIESAVLSTRQAVEIPFTAQNGRISVNPAGQAPEVVTVPKGEGSFETIEKRGLVILAGISILVFLISLGVFIYALRQRR